MRDFYFHTQDLTVGYGGLPLIRDVNLQLKKGEILTLIGPNGAGKTTVLKSIIRQLPPLGGTVWLDGRDVACMTGNELAKELSVVLTERLRPEMMTCGDVVATGRYPYTGRFGILGQEDWKIVDDSMELVGIRELKERNFDQISDGQKQRVMLARALCQQPDLIVLDEPTSFLDIRYKLEFLSILQRMARTRKLSVLMSLHELDLAARVSDRIACVKGDRIQRLGTPEEIFTDGYIRQLYEIKEGFYDEGSQTLELPAPSGIPQVLVIAGKGRGTSVFRRLQREGIPFATGILWENDLDYPSARALASEIVSVPPFEPIARSHMDRMKDLCRRCGQVIWALGREELTGAAAPMAELEKWTKGPIG